MDTIERLRRIIGWMYDEFSDINYGEYPNEIKSIEAFKQDFSYEEFKEHLKKVDEFLWIFADDERFKNTVLSIIGSSI